MSKETIKGIIVGVISSLIASGIFYSITEKLLWNYNLPVWLWLSVTVGVYMIYKLIKYIIFRRRLNNILSEFKEGRMGDSFPYTWEYNKCKGPYSVYGYDHTTSGLKTKQKNNFLTPIPLLYVDTMFQNMP